MPGLRPTTFFCSTSSSPHFSERAFLYFKQSRCCVNVLRPHACEAFWVMWKNRFVEARHSHKPLLRRDQSFLESIRRRFSPVSAQVHSTTFSIATSLTCDATSRCDEKFAGRWRIHSSCFLRRPAWSRF